MVALVACVQVHAVHARERAGALMVAGTASWRVVVQSRAAAAKAAEARREGEAVALLETIDPLVRPVLLSWLLRVGAF